MSECKGVSHFFYTTTTTILVGIQGSADKKVRKILGPFCPFFIFHEEAGKKRVGGPFKIYNYRGIFQTCHILLVPKSKCLFARDFGLKLIITVLVE